MIESACLAANARRMKGGDAIADVTATTPSREVAAAIIAASGIGSCSGSEICELTQNGSASPTLAPRPQYKPRNAAVVTGALKLAYKN